MKDDERICFGVDEGQLADDICLLRITHSNFELNGSLVKSSSIDSARIFICEIYFDNDTNLGYSGESFLIKVRMSEAFDEKFGSFADKGCLILLHKGFNLFKCKKYLHIRVLSSDYFFDVDHSSGCANKRVDVCFSGPYFLSKYCENTSVYMLNYRKLLIESLKRQFYLYILLVLGLRNSNSSTFALNYERVFKMKNVSFMINERYYHFRILYIKSRESDFSDKKKNFFDQNNSNGGLFTLENVFLIPRIEENFVLTNRNSDKEELFYSSTFKETIQILKYFEKTKIVTDCDKYCKCTLYIDTSYLLKNYIQESNLSPKVLECIYDRIILNVSTLLNIVVNLNEILVDYRILVNVCFYNFKSTFKRNMILRNVNDEYLSKVVYIEYDYNNIPGFCSLLSKECISDYTRLILEYKRHNLCYYSDYVRETDTGSKSLSVESESHYDNYLLYVNLITDLSKVGGIYSKTLIKNYNMFLRLLSYLHFYSERRECPDKALIDSIKWIIKNTFSIKSGNGSKVIYDVMRILARYPFFKSVWCLKSIDCLLNEERSTHLCEGYNSDKPTDCGGNPNLGCIFDQIVQKIDSEIKIHSFVNKNSTSVGDFINQIYVSRMLLYRDESSNNRLYFLKNNIYSYIKNNNSSYRVIYKHMLTLISPYFGQSESNIRRLFSVDEPTILFLDGIDMLTYSNKNKTGANEHDYSSVFKFGDRKKPEKVSVKELMSVRSIKHKANYHRFRFESITGKNSRPSLNNDFSSKRVVEECSHHERTVLTTLLLCLDNIEKRNQNIIVIAFSNRHISDLDDSVTRAGRFDIHIPV
ncbi:hypothetical protein FG386_001689 [Cryptosporidium ryanae]|uniref:uncharacterized protein n=1 Tax=Cryptosporidium ryanae TaxID=515981 RepID=UPI00351A29B7|nr:hypothetical protein FG386_001689 [Cryptosporidium ryanae]